MQTLLKHNKARTPWARNVIVEHATGSLKANDGENGDISYIRTSDGGGLGHL